MNLGGDDARYDPLDDKKPRAGQILWIRGLTRLQTQVSDFSKTKTSSFLLNTLYFFIQSLKFLSF